MPSKVEYARLGDITFVVSDGISAFDQTGGFEFAQHDHAAGKASLQAMGEVLDEITIDIQLRRFFGHDVSGMIEKIEKMKKSGEPQKLVFASGIYQGEFVVKRVSSKVIRTDSKGAVSSADLTVELLEFADRKVTASRKSETKPTGEPVKRKVIKITV